MPSTTFNAAQPRMLARMVTVLLLFATSAIGALGSRVSGAGDAFLRGKVQSADVRHQQAQQLPQQVPPQQFIQQQLQLQQMGQQMGPQQQQQLLLQEQQLQQWQQQQMQMQVQMQVQMEVQQERQQMQKQLQMQQEQMQKLSAQLQQQLEPPKPKLQEQQFVPQKSLVAVNATVKHAALAMASQKAGGGGVDTPRGWDQCMHFARYIKAQQLSGVEFVRTWTSTCDPAVRSGRATETYRLMCNSLAGAVTPFATGDYDTNKVCEAVLVVFHNGLGADTR